MTDQSGMSGMEPGPGEGGGASRPWLSSKGILLLLCVFIICMCAIIGLVVYLIILKGKSLPGGAPLEKEGPDR